VAVDGKYDVGVGEGGSAVVFSIIELKVIGRTRVWPQEWNAGPLAQIWGMGALAK
jgi:hypothetical protein